MVHQTGIKSKKQKMEMVIEIPSDINVELRGPEVTLKKGDKSVTKKFLGLLVEHKDGKIVLSSKRSGKKERKLIMTYFAHINNILKGLNADFTYKLKVCAVHFPMTVNVDKAKGELVVKNFLGEKIERRAKILPNVEVQVKGDEIVVTSFNVENAGQTAANFEKTTRITSRDRRVFQDGIFLTERKGEKI